MNARPFAGGLLFVLFVLLCPAQVAAQAGTCNFTLDTVELMKARFNELRQSSEVNINLIVGLGSNRDDRSRREQLFRDWGDVGGRTREINKLNEFTAFLNSLSERCRQ